MGGVGTQGMPADLVASNLALFRRTTGDSSLLHACRQRCRFTGTTDKSSITLNGEVLVSHSNCNIGGCGGSGTSDVVIKTATHCARSISVDAIEKKSTSNGLWRFSFFLLNKSTESKKNSPKKLGPTGAGRPNGEPGRHPA